MSKTCRSRKKFIIFRIIQVALHNIFKHSQAKNIDVYICYKTGQLKIIITDDGIGFYRDRIKKKDDLGLQNIVTPCSIDRRRS
jgi:two-component system NarL family sensor kinase